MVRPSRFISAAIGAVAVAGLGAIAVTAPAYAAESWEVPSAVGLLRPANTPSGTEALVWSNGTATTTVTGSGTVVVHARAELCEGGAEFELAVDGQVLGRSTVLNPTSGTYWEYPVGAGMPAGTYAVSIRFTNDHMTSNCDRNLVLGWVSMTGSAGLSGGGLGQPVSSRNPFASAAPYVDPDYPSVAAAAERRSWDPAGAAALDKISSAGGALWVGDWMSADAAEQAVRDYTGDAAAAGRTAVVVVYAIPARDCGLYSHGGLTPQAYPRFVEAVADGLRGTSAAVILEPDAVAQMGDCAEQGDRAGLLRDAVAQLAGAGGAVYLDGGNSAWLDTATMADRLRESGIDMARGFATNVSNFRTTSDERVYGDQLAAALDTHYVIDTSRNGNGPLGNGPLDWCNPTGRALGEQPAAVNDGSALDAVLYIKRVGESDGTCERNEPTAGEFWSDYAIGLAQRAAW